MENDIAVSTSGRENTVHISKNLFTTICVHNKFNENESVGTSDDGT